MKDSSVGEESPSDADINEPSTSAAGEYRLSVLGVLFLAAFECYKN